MRFLRLFTSLVLFFLCLKSYSVELNDISTFPGWFKKLINREVKVEEISQLNLKALNIKEMIKGNIIEESSDETYHYFRIDMGAETPVECYTFTEFDGPANSLLSVSTAAIEYVSKFNDKNVSGKYNFSVDSGAIDSSPYLQLDRMYNLGQGKNKVVGLMKGYSALTGDLLQLCLHNEIGYRESFFSVFESYVKAFIVPNDNAFYTSVHQYTLNEVPAGFTSETYITDDDGDIKTTSRSSMLIPTSSKDVLVSDASGIEWSYPDGNIINAEVTSVENGTLSFSYQLNPIDEGWSVDGVVQGKKLNSNLGYSENLLSSLGIYLEVANVNQLKESSNLRKMWLPDLDPKNPVDVVVDYLNSNPVGNTQITMGPMKIIALANKDGAFESAEMEVGPMKMDIKVLYEEGSPKL